MKINSVRVTAFVLLIALSVGFGFAFDGIATALERSSHPRPEDFAPLVEAYASEFALPEATVWGVIKVRSDFQSNKHENGRVGLFQLTAAEFDFICRELLGLGAVDPGLLYDPATNLRAGCAYLSYLFLRYATEEEILAALIIGPDAVDAYLANPAHRDENGHLTELPKETQDGIEELILAIELYEQLYYTNEH